METEDLIVVGAGVAGLTLARRLSANDRPVRILEARDRVGGRTVSFEHGGTEFDLGASWIWESEDAVLGLVDGLGLKTYPSHRGGIDLFETPATVERVQLPGPSVAEYRIEGGTAAIARALAGDLQVELSRSVREVAADGDGVRLVLDDETIRANSVVWAAPPALLGTVVKLTGVDDDHLGALAHTPVWMGDMAKVVARYDRPFWLKRGLSGRVFSHRGPMVEVHDLSGPDRDAAPALFGFVPRSRAQGDWRAEALAQLERLFGPEAASPAAFEVKAWWTDRETIPQRHQPAQQLLGHPFLRRPLLDGRLHLASTEAASIGAGHIDGAVRRATSLADVLAPA